MGPIPNGTDGVRYVFRVVFCKTITHSQHYTNPNPPKFLQKRKVTQNRLAPSKISVIGSGEKRDPLPAREVQAHNLTDTEHDEWQPQQEQESEPEPGPMKRKRQVGS
jgi:hypothetical protein